MESNDTACCINDHDAWVQIADFDNPELNDYVSAAAERLGMTVAELKATCESQETARNPKGGSKPCASFTPAPAK